MSTVWFNGRTFKTRKVGTREAVDYQIQGSNQSGYVVCRPANLSELLRQQKLAAGGRTLLPINA